MDAFLLAYGTPIIAFVLILGAVIFVRQSRQHRIAGNPKIVQDGLGKLGAEYTVLSDVVVSADLGMSHVRHVVVSIYGVVVITDKTEAGKLFGKEGEREWQLKPSREILYNPLWENRKHINALEKITGPVWFIPLVVFTRARLMVYFGAYVINLKSLIPYIEQNKKSRLSVDKRDEIIAKLRAISSN